MSKLTKYSSPSAIYSVLGDLKITPYRVQSLFDGTTIYEFWRVSSKIKSIQDPEAKRQMSMIVVKDDRFTLHYYSYLTQDNIVVKDLPLDQLRTAVQDLIQIGFK